jgi:hypothetical protein
MSAFAFRGKRLVRFLGFSLFVSASLVSCGRRQAVWQGTIHDVGGVTVVENPAEPMAGRDACRIEEELSIGKPEESGEFYFSEIRDVAVDDEENIYVLDFKEPFIRVFDKSGNRLWTFGKRGQGPGEIQGPTNLCLTPRGELLVNDRGNRFLHFYTLAGEYKRSLSLARWLSFSRPVVDAKDNIIARSAVSGLGRNLIFVLKKFDPGLNESFDIFSYQADTTPDVFNVFPADCFWKVGKEGRIVWGYSDKYEVRILESQGKVSRRITRNYIPVEITSEEKNAWLLFAFGDRGIPANVKVNWPRHHNAFQFLLVDDEDRIFVQTYEKLPDGKGFYCDVFDPEGRFLAKFALRGGPRAVKNGRVYSIDEDEQGYPLIKRHKVTWKL